MSAESISPDHAGWERLNELIERDVDSEEHHSNKSSSFYPQNQVDIVVQYEGRSGSRTVEGTLIQVRASLEQDEEKREEQRYNGWFGKVRTSDGFVNVYADPDSSGPRIIFCPDWDGSGGKRYKYPIEEIVVEEKPDQDPQCWKCHSTMEFGMYRDAPEDHHGITMGWICRNCASDSVPSLGFFDEHDVERGLP